MWNHFRVRRALWSIVLPVGSKVFTVFTGKRNNNTVYSRWNDVAGRCIVLRDWTQFMEGAGGGVYWWFCWCTAPTSCWIHERKSSGDKFVPWSWMHHQPGQYLVTGLHMIYVPCSRGCLFGTPALGSSSSIFHPLPRLSPGHSWLEGAGVGYREARILRWDFPLPLLALWWVGGCGDRRPATNGGQSTSLLPLQWQQWVLECTGGEGLR